MVKIKKEDSKTFLADVPEGYVFRCHDSCVFKNILELKDSLSNMPEEVYVYHANPERNDFRGIFDSRGKSII
jgi:hypothetical protein